jgi:hypothetical protein
MISRDLTLTITDTNVSLDKTITLYRYDRGITLNLTLKSEVYDIVREKTTEGGETVVVGEIVQARAIILRPNKKLSATERKDIKNGVYELYLDDTYTDHLGEIGKYQIQLQLYSNTPNDECITIAPFIIEVKNPIGIPQDSAAYVDQAIVDSYSASYAADLPTGDLENGEYLKTSWIGGDLITSGKLNKIESAVDYLVGESATHLTNDTLEDALDLYAKKTDVEDFATEQYVNDAITNIELISSNTITGIEVVDEDPGDVQDGILYFVKNK